MWEKNEITVQETNMKNKTHSDAPAIGMIGNVIDDIRQQLFPAEFRIAAPYPKNTMTETPMTEAAEDEPEINVPAEEPDVEVMQTASASLSDVSNHTKQIAETATCLWYLKTNFFKTAWREFDFDKEDPRVRRALNRIQKTVDKLSEGGIEIHDPVNKRYPPGSEGMMRPVQLLPTDGIEFETVVETLSPVIFYNERLLQRGEVFVAIPRIDRDSDAESSPDKAQEADSQEKSD